MVPGNCSRYLHVFKVAMCLATPRRRRQHCAEQNVEAQVDKETRKIAVSNNDDDPGFTVT